MFKTRSGKILSRCPTDWEEMLSHVHSLWPGATYHNTVGSGFWSNGNIMVAECWPHRTDKSLWRWRVATPESGGLTR